MPNQNDIRQAITNQIISALESGNVPPWRRPWKLGKNAGGAANVVTKRSYRGLNPILLDMASEKHGLASKWWGTFKQWKAMGGRVMPRPSHIPPGKWGTQIVFWSPVTKKVENDQGDLEDDRFFVLGFTPFSTSIRSRVLTISVPGSLTPESLSSSIISLPRKPLRRRVRTFDSAAERHFIALLGITSRFRPRRRSSLWMNTTALVCTNFAIGANPA